MIVRYSSQGRSSLVTPAAEAAQAERSQLKRQHRQNILALEIIGNHNETIQETGLFKQEQTESRRKNLCFLFPPARLWLD